MLTIAIELSSNQGSVALVSETGVIAERSWNDSVHDRQALYDSIQALLSEAFKNWDDVDFYSVGRGPGSFSGLRVGFTVANALALPDEKPVIAVSSGEAMALSLFEESKSPKNIAVIGDARRQMCWLGQFKCSESGTEKTMDFELIPYEEIGDKIFDDSFIVTSEWERLEEKLKNQCPNAELVESDFFPHARYVGEIAIKRFMSGEGGEEFEPLYMHPPVFVKPKYE